MSTHPVISTMPADLDLKAELKTLGCTNFKLRQLMRQVAQHYDLEMASAGLKTTQYSLLSYVLKLGPLRPGELAKSMKMSASTLTRNLKPLVDAGWLELTAGSDARSRTVAITPAGRAKREEALGRWKVAQESLNQRLGAGRVIALHGLINESLELLSPVNPEPEPGADDE
ncbi:MarR family winged helix-turn-helix transcriptional regulator [Polaromonas naphthalenivorans]|uniref:Transcriptional regulator, MarR family n=1 Tax=Polaromonas naphthalenivorans (strain CJ2) TaxID=365044 RepID=A1VRJ9_POLNA|nr:transcriptional regulator, MarR family [Polaromonas naphthalenivorans CJ2]